MLLQERCAGAAPKTQEGATGVLRCGQLSRYIGFGGMQDVRGAQPHCVQVAQRLQTAEGAHRLGSDEKRDPIIGNGRLSVAFGCGVSQ